MINGNSQMAEIDVILEAARKIARRTQRHFVVDDEKRDDFIKFSAILAANAGAKALDRWENPPPRTLG